MPTCAVYAIKIKTKTGKILESSKEFYFLIIQK